MLHDPILDFARPLLNRARLRSSPFRSVLGKVRRIHALLVLLVLLLAFCVSARVSLRKHHFLHYVTLSKRALSPETGSQEGDTDDMILDEDVSTTTPAAGTTLGNMPRPSFIESEHAKAIRQTMPVAASLAGTNAGDPDWQNQDQVWIRHLSKYLLMAGVFDGHGEHGRLAATTVSDIFEKSTRAPTMTLEHKVDNPMKFLNDLFATATNALKEDERFTWSGTTATVVLMNLNKSAAIIAYVGDSRAVVLDTDMQAKVTTKDHRIGKDALVGEKELVAQGCEVRSEMHCGHKIKRVYDQAGQHGTMLSRSLGDSGFHALGISATPEVLTVPFPVGSILVVGSKGLWSVTKRADLGQRLRQTLPKNPYKAVKAVVTEAREAWDKKYEPSIDDISAAIMKFGDPFSPKPATSDEEEDED